MAIPKDQAALETSIGELLDDGDFHELDRRLGRFNLFEAVGGVRAELRHSNFLGFVFSPNRSHGLLHDHPPRRHGAPTSSENRWMTS